MSLADVLATCGLWFLVSQAGITVPIRSAIASRSAFAAALLSCPFCLGFWCALAVRGARALPGPWAPCASAGLWALSAAFVVYLVHQADEALERHGRGR